jgi:hypothetical protein
MVDYPNLPWVRLDARYKWKAKVNDTKAAENFIIIEQEKYLLTCMHDGIQYRNLKNTYDSLRRWVNLESKINK